jgi:hypothetical protein
MSIHTILDSHGEIVSVVNVPDEATLTANTPSGCTCVDGAPPFPDAYFTTEWVQKPAQPAIHLAWDVYNKVWYDPRSLAEIKAAKWDEIKVARANADYSPITVDGHTFDANQESQQKIAGAVQLALLAGSDWSIDWTLTDNTVHTLTQAEMINVGVALGQRTSAIYSTARQLRIAIETAIDADDVQLITWQ